MKGNYLENVAIVGAGGQVGSPIVQALLAEGKLKVTALTRADSTSTIPEGVTSKTIDYNNKSSIVEALKGQDALIITMNVMAPREQSATLIEAAAEAGVPWVLPNEFSSDYDSGTSLGDEMQLAPIARALRKQVEDLGVSSWVGISCSFWYEYSLSSGPVLFGFDFKEKEVTFFNDGTQKIPVSTLPQTGRAVAKVLGLPVESEGGSPSLSQWKNKAVYVQSFNVSQKDMFKSILRVTGEKESDWKISYEDAKERWQKGKEQMMTGDRRGFVRAMYSRVFFPENDANYTKTKGVANELLGLPKEDFDEWTKTAVKMAENAKMYLK